ncbi:MAG: hypothetical protein IJB25_09510 [Clostridia bacterium]|nr:hypothetical protein [Clostridia bacterium]MBQ3232729.1 hypothetical protein [Clostridia bacterium]MBQ4157909.1 hypothetical protein [Clostridia bacterium]MBQ4620092.1 hypothetical protein [Clostridia bacterium]
MPRIITKREYRKRRIRYQVAAGLFDFVMTIVSFFVIVLCVYLITSLYSWVKADVPVTFGIFFDIIKKAFTMH